MSDVVAMRDVIVIGGGCYGTFYAGQLAKAKAKGKARFRRVVVVDRAATCRARGELGEAPDRAFAVEEWGAFFDRFLAGVHTPPPGEPERSEEHTSELQSLAYLVCRLLLEKKKSLHIRWVTVAAVRSDAAMKR